MNKSPEHENLIDRYLTGMADEVDVEQLETLLKTDEELRQTFLAASRIDSHLREQAEQLTLVKEEISRPLKSHFAWINPGSVAGLLIGLFSASVVWAYVAPRGGEITRTSQEIVSEGFEDSDIELPTHLPVKANEWCGRLVSVTPRGGISAFEGKRVGRLIPKAGNRSESLSRIVDLHDYPDLESGYVRSLRVKGSFMAPFTGQNPGFHVRIVAFGQAPEDVRQAWRDRWNSDAMILQGVERKHLPEKDEQGNWHEVSASLEIPEGTRSIMVALGVWHLNPDMSVPDLYLDAVQVQLVDTCKPPAKPN